MFLFQLLGGQNLQVCQKFFHLRDSVAGGAGMAALAAVIAPLAGKAIIRAKRDDTTTKNVDARGVGGRRDARATLQDGPAERAMAYVKCEFQVLNNFCAHIFFLIDTMSLISVFL